ncbi:MAG: TolC family protein [Gammaproteobacteria bacterium]|nr:MAG: TolC family protein [Gammaproteobacteria bacterium]
MKHRILLLFAFPPLLAMGGARAAETLGLAQAEQAALARAVSAPAIEARARALSEEAVAAGELPDPKLKLGMMNLPTDSFSRAQEAMTQLQLGVRQAIPPRGTLRARRAGVQARARAAHWRAAAARRKVLREVRQAWLEVWYQVEGGRLVDSLRTLFEQLVEVTRDYYAAGRKNQQDVLRAQVELSLLDDRRTRFRTGEEAARAVLARWVGAEAAGRELPRDFPKLPPLPDVRRLRTGLSRHPEVLAAVARIEAARQALAEARARYRPGLMLDLTHGSRVGRNPDGSPRADFLSAIGLDRSAVVPPGPAGSPAACPAARARGRTPGA